jgi:hypothetical protein
MELWAVGAIALLAFYSNYMVAPLIPAFSRKFAVLPDALGWLVPGFWLAHDVQTQCLSMPRLPMRCNGPAQWYW